MPRRQAGDGPGRAPRIRPAQVRPALTAAARKMGVATYQEQAKWGDAVVEQLSADLRAAFPDRKGLSRDNVFRVRQLYPPPADAEILMPIDGKKDRWRVHLSDGISTTTPTTPICPSAQ